MKKKSQLKIPQFLLYVGFLIITSGISVNSWGNTSGVDVGNEQQQSGISISGVVMDKQDVIIGASIFVKGTTMGTITDYDGKFTLDNVPENAEIQISYIGYVTQTIKLGTQRSFQITLVEDSKTLDEVIVVGYGTQKKVNLTGSVGQVDGKVLESRPVLNASSALQGTIPNLQITPTSGEPGAAVNLNIRGTTSINGGGPLVLVDGVEMDLDLVNPNDIANVTVLKDAAAAAIYGVRAAYGVILVTTKTAGSDMKTSVSYSGSVAFSKPTVLPKMVKTSWEHAEYINQACANGNVALLYTDDEIAKMKAYASNPSANPEYGIVEGKFQYYGYTDWMDLMLKNLTPSHRHNVNISGGNEKTKFYSSIGYLHQAGMYKVGDDNNYKRLNTRLSVDNQTTPWLKLNAKVLYNYTARNKPHNYKDDVWRSMVYSTPTKMASPWPGMKEYPQYDDYIGRYFEDQNPISLLEQGGQDRLQQHDVWLTAGADLKIMEGWSAKVDFTYNLNYSRESKDAKAVDMITSTFAPSQGNTSNDFLTWENLNKDYYSFNAYTEYENTFAGKHYFKGMAGFNQELTKYRKTEATQYGQISPGLPTLTLGTGISSMLEEGYEWALRGGFFRLNYIYDNRYLFEVNGRYDGTSRFPKNHRFVFLPSFSGAWRISEEKFMQSTRSWLDNLKLRASYGVLGNQLLSSTEWTNNRKYYPYMPLMQTEEMKRWLFDSSSKETYINPAFLVTPDLTWEKAATINAGIDITLLDQRLDMAFDIYQRTTSDMLVMVKYPEVLGATAPPSNYATLRTRGWELSVKWRDKIGKNFTYDIGFVLSDSQAEITKYNNPTGSIDTYYKGQKVGDIWGYVTEGIFQSQEEVNTHADQSKIGSGWQPGDIKYKNLDGNTASIDPGNRTLDDHGDLAIIGNTTPRYQYGITLGMTYKDVWVNMFFQGVGKRDFWPEAQPFWPAYTQYYNTQQWFLDDTWSADNPDAYFARPIVGNQKNWQKQSRYIQNGAYMRMKNLSVGYNLPAHWLKHVYISKANVYFSAENLFEFSKIKGAYDPESAYAEDDKDFGKMIYPFQRTYSIGVNLTF